jgi:hypothetical protein
MVDTAAFVAARSLTSHREWLIAEIEAGDMRLPELRDAEEHDGRVGTIKVVCIAQAIPGAGKLEARRAMGTLGIPPDARWGELVPEAESALWAALQKHT